MASRIAQYFGFGLDEPEPAETVKVATPATPPRKTPVGTSFTAKGLEGVPPPQLDTESGSSAPIQIRELVPELATSFQRISVYGSMMNDAGVDVSIRAAKTPVLGAEYFVEPYSDSPQDKEIAEFVWANLAEGMSAPFINSLEDILQFYTDGYSITEKVYELREWSPNRKAANTRQYTMLRKLGLRPASTIKDIEYDDNGGPIKAIQNAIQGDGKIKEVPLDIGRIMIFTFSRRGGDLTGRSLLRTAYPHWYYKTHLYKIDAIQKERHSLGVPKGKLQPGYTVQDRTILRQLLRNLRTNEEAYMVLTPNVDVEFAKVEGQLVDVLASATHHNMMILMNVMGQFLSLGTEGSGGGRATGGVQSDLFMKALRYVANYIADVINMYLIPELVVWNYPTKNFPKLKCRNIGETRDIQMLAAGLSNLASQGLITMDIDTEQWVRRVFDMPSKQANSEPTAAPDGGDNTNGNKKGSVPARIRPGNTGKPSNAPD